MHAFQLFQKRVLQLDPSSAHTEIGKCSKLGVGWSRMVIQHYPKKRLHQMKANQNLNCPLKLNEGAWK